MADALSHHPAFSQLLEGCQRLGLEPTVAKELINYLNVKRSLLSGDSDRQRTAQSMSPSVNMDQLWHWMLLNTHVRDEVHKLVGGDVPHTTGTESDPEHIKQARRSIAQKAMKRFGSLPNPNVWSSETTISNNQLQFNVHQSKPKDITVYVKLSGNYMPYEISNSATVLELKEMIKDKTGIPPDEFRLSNGNTWRDDKPLVYYTYDNEKSFLDVYFPLRGC